MSPNPLEGPMMPNRASPKAMLHVACSRSAHIFPDEPVIMSLTAYSKAASYAHWAVAVPLIGCVGTGAYYSTFKFGWLVMVANKRYATYRYPSPITNFQGLNPFSGTLPTSILPDTVLKAQEAPKAEKGLWMHRHKSLGLLTGILVAPRLGYRLFNAAKYRVGHIAGTGPLEQKAADASHFLLYGFMTIMPASGIAMGYFGGKGLPFFGTTIPGIVHTDETKKGNQKIAGQAFKIHKQLGTYGKFLIPLHAAGAVQHAARGHTIFARINPFRSPKH